MVDWAGRVADEQVVVRGARRAGELADCVRGLVPANGPIGRALEPVGERGQAEGAGRHERHAVPARVAVVLAAIPPGLVPPVVHPGRAERRGTDKAAGPKHATVRGPAAEPGPGPGTACEPGPADAGAAEAGDRVAGADRRHLDEGPEPAVVLVVILLEHDLLVRKL